MANGSTANDGNSDDLTYFFPDEIDLDSPIPEPTLYPCPPSLLSELPLPDYSLYGRCDDVNR